MLDRIELAVGLGTGPNELDVWLTGDGAGAPGSIVETFHFSGAMGPFGSVNPALLADSLLNPVLSAGSQYWLVASVTGPNATAGWNDNSIGFMHPTGQRTDLGPWVVFEAALTFRVSGTPIPEPSSLALAALALVGLTASLWCRKRGTRRLC